MDILDQRQNELSSDLRADISPDTRLLLKAMAQTRDALRQEQQKQGLEQVERMSALERELRETNKRLTEAFPEGDLQAHRKYHEEVMAFRRRLNQWFWDGLKQVTWFGGAGISAWIAISIWNAFKHEITR